MLGYYGDLFTKWWFWVTLPVVLPLMFALDHALAVYNRRYWRARGHEPPPHRRAYKVDAGSFVLYAAIALYGTLFELVRGRFAGAAAFAVATVVLASLALVQARRNVI